MANQALIQAVSEANPKFSPAGEVFSETFEYRINQYSKAAKESSEKWDEVVSLAKKPKIDALGNTPEMTKSMYNLYSSERNNFLSEAKNLSPYDPKLKDLVLNYSQLVTDGEVATATHKQFFDYISKANLSSVNDKSTADLVERYMKIGIGTDENNQIVYKDENGIVPMRELASIQDQIIEVPEVIYNKMTRAADGLLLAKQPFELIKSRLEYMIGSYMDDKAYGEDFIFDSLGGDVTPYNLSADQPSGNFRLGKYKGMTKSEILDVAKKQVGDDLNAQMEFLKKEVLSGYMTAFKGVHSMANPPKETKPTQTEINKAEKAKTGDEVIDTVFSEFSEAAGKGNLDFLTGQGISYKKKSIKTIETKSSGKDSKGNIKPATATLVYDVDGGKQEMAFDVTLTPEVIGDLLLSYAESKYGKLDTNARLKLMQRAKKAYSGGILLAPDPYADFLKSN